MGYQYKGRKRRRELSQLKTMTGKETKASSPCLLLYSDLNGLDNAHLLEKESLLYWESTNSNTNFSWKRNPDICHKCDEA